jgi:hypothetical protein
MPHDRELLHEALSRVLSRRRSRTLRELKEVAALKGKDFRHNSKCVAVADRDKAMQVKMTFDIFPTSIYLPDILKNISD